MRQQNTATSITNNTTQRHVGVILDTMDDSYGHLGSPFVRMEHGHKDMVGSVGWNSYGTRCATGSADGKLKVFDRQKDGTLDLVDTWTAHNAEVLEVSDLECNLIFKADWVRYTGSHQRSTQTSSHP